MGNRGLCGQLDGSECGGPMSLADLGGADFLKELVFCFELDLPIQSGISLLCLKVHMSLQGTLVRIREARYQVKTLLGFTARTRMSQEFSKWLVNGL